MSLSASYEELQEDSAMSQPHIHTIQMLQTAQLKATVGTSIWAGWLRLFQMRFLARRACEIFSRGMPGPWPMSLRILYPLSTMANFRRADCMYFGVQYELHSASTCLFSIAQQQSRTKVRGGSQAPMQGSALPAHTHRGKLSSKSCMAIWGSYDAHL